MPHNHIAAGLASVKELLLCSSRCALLQVVRIVQAVPTLLNISPQTIKRRMRLANAGLHAWSLGPADLMPSVLGRLLTASDARIARLLYISFLHRRLAPQPSRSGAVAVARTAAAGRTVAAAAVARVAAALGARKAEKQRVGRSQRAERGPGRGARSRSIRMVAFSKAGAPVGGVAGNGGAGEVSTARGAPRRRQTATPPRKKPITILNMKDAEFKEAYPRFERWYRRQSRISSVGDHLR